MSKKFKLPKEFAEKWIEALESGEYKQANGYLYQEDYGYCCLGVAGVVCGIDQDVLESKGTFVDIKTLAKEHNIPDILIHSENDSVTLVGVLVDLNDNNLDSETKKKLEKEEGFIFPEENMNAYGFEEIAKFIKLNVEFV